MTVLMPPPFSTHHHAYLQTYHATGKGAILNCMRELVALHKVRAQRRLLGLRAGHGAQGAARSRPPARCTVCSRHPAPRDWHGAGLQTA